MSTSKLKMFVCYLFASVWKQERWTYKLNINEIIFMLFVALANCLHLQAFVIKKQNHTHTK